MSRVKCWCGCGRDAEETRRQDAREFLILGIATVLLLVVAWSVTG